MDNIRIKWICAIIILLFFKHTITIQETMTLPVGVSDQGVLNQLVNLFCVLPIRMVMQRDTRFILVQAIEALLPV